MRSSERIRVEAAREEMEQAVLQLERAQVRERTARWKLDEALDALESKSAQKGTN